MTKRKERRKSISIHALREEGDRRHHSKRAQFKNFYPRPPRGGRRYIQRGHSSDYTFLSTPSARRATFLPILSEKRASISIHALREEGDRKRHGRASRMNNFYPRPPRGGRPSNVVRIVWSLLFLSTPSARRATGQQPSNDTPLGISIHALREEGDLCARKRACVHISIHALREEGDRKHRRTTGEKKNFYPRPPRGGRQQKRRKHPRF